MLHEKKICQPATEQSADAVAAAEPPGTSNQVVYLELMSPATPFDVLI